MYESYTFVGSKPLKLKKVCEREECLCENMCAENLLGKGVFAELRMFKWHLFNIFTFECATHGNIEQNEDSRPSLTIHDQI